MLERRYWRFLYEVLPDEADIPEEERVQLYDAPSPSACVEFVDWGLEHIASFVERCRSAALVTPYEPAPPASEGPIEGWVVCNLGEFVYFVVPELAADVPARLTAVRMLVRKPVYLHVLTLPARCGAPAGRYLNDDGVVVWGNYPWVTTHR